jgi:hypothetical protein
VHDRFDLLDMPPEMDNYMVHLPPRTSFCCRSLVSRYSDPSMSQLNVELEIANVAFLCICRASWGGAGEGSLAGAVAGGTGRPLQSLKAQLKASYRLLMTWVKTCHMNIGSNPRITQHCASRLSYTGSGTTRPPKTMSRKS